MKSNLILDVANTIFDSIYNAEVDTKEVENANLDNISEKQTDTEKVNNNVSVNNQEIEIDSEELKQSCRLRSDKYKGINHKIIPLFKRANVVMFLERLDTWLQINERNQKNGKSKVDIYHEGRYWCFQTYTEWEKDLLSISRSTICRIVNLLKEMGVVIVSKFNKYGYDQTNWYTIDYKKLKELEEEFLDEKTQERLDKIDTQEEKRKENSKKSKQKKQQIRNNKKFRKNTENAIDSVAIKSLGGIATNLIGTKTSNFKIDLEVTDKNQIYILEVINNSLAKDKVLRVCNKFIPVTAIVEELKKLSQEELIKLITFVSKRFETKANKVKKKSAYIKSIFVNGIYEKEYLVEDIKAKNNTSNQSSYSQSIYPNKFVNYQQKDLDYDLLRRIEEKSLL